MSPRPCLQVDQKWERQRLFYPAVLRIGKGRFRIWYASRRKPPFRNKYFALNTDV